MKNELTRKKGLLISTGALSLIYILLEIFLLPYLQKLVEMTFISYGLYFVFFVRPIGILAISIFLIKLLQYKKILLGFRKKIFVVIGICIYIIYYLLLIPYFFGSIPEVLAEIVYQLGFKTYFWWILAIAVSVYQKE